VASDEDRRAARVLAGLAMTEVGRAPGEGKARSPLRRLTGGRRLRPRGWLDDPEPDTPWRDIRSANRPGWRERAAYLDSEQVFAVDYQICRHCSLGWVEEPYTHPDYQRCGLAAAALAALRSEHSGLEWHTLGGHFRDVESFWSAVGANVNGGYTKRGICPHQTAG
jgi:hypothetical protein